jgi:hypothetical protein
LGGFIIRLRSAFQGMSLVAKWQQNKVEFDAWVIREAICPAQKTMHISDSQ